MSFAVYESRALFRVLSRLHLSEIRKSAREGWVDSSRLKIRNLHEISERQRITINVAWCRSKRYHRGFRGGTKNLNGPRKRGDDGGGRW